MKRIDWFVARRYLSSTRKGRFGSFSTLVSIGGVAVGVMALLIVVAVMTGLQRDLKSKILGSTPHIYIFEPVGEFILGDWQRVLNVVRETPGVKAAEPFILSTVGIVSANRPTYGQPASLQGIDPMSSKDPLTDIERQIRLGAVPWGPTKSGLPGVLVGSRLAVRMQVFSGDTIVVMSIENMKISAISGLTPNMQQFEVTGTFDSGMYEYDNMNIYGDLREVQSYLGMSPDTVSGIAVNVEDEQRADDYAATLRARLDHKDTTQTWLDLNRSLFDALKLEKLAMEVILSLIILVASFNIVSTLMMLVTEKTREIGILKSMGMTDGSVLRIFITQGLIIGVIGTALGMLGGLGIMYVIKHFNLISLPADVYFIDRLPLRLETFDGVMIVVVSLLIALLSTIYPAWKASKLVPVDAIRHD
ncbi:MAG: ABC transporter permease [Longimicrobiales bacterium]